MKPWEELMEKMGELTEYEADEEAASALLNDEARESYLDWYNEKENKYYRYEKKTARLAVGTQNGSISTFFILQKALRKYYLPNEYLELAEGK